MRSTVIFSKDSRSTSLSYKKENQSYVAETNTKPQTNAHTKQCYTLKLPHTFLPRTQISKTALKASHSPSHHRDHNCTLNASSGHPTPMDPLHLAANTLITHNTATTHQHDQPTTPPTNDNTPQAKLGLEK